MKTPMQKLIDSVGYMAQGLDADELYDYFIEEATRLLEKERERLCDAYIKGGDAQYQYIIEGSFPYNTAEDWYNETFKTKER